MPTELQALPPTEVRHRLDRLRARLTTLGCDALLVTDLTNVRYLSGFTGSAGLLLVAADDDALLVTDGRYGEQAVRQLTEAQVAARVEVSLTTAGQYEILTAASADAARLGLEARSISWAEQRTLQTQWFTGSELVPTERAVEALRRTKDAGEIARIEAAARIADEAFDELLPSLEGRSETDAALAFEVAVRRRGAGGPSFETIVASGPNGSRPHARPTERIMRAGDTIVIDCGAVVDGYRSDMTRTVCIGEPASKDLVHVFDLVVEAQAAGVAAVAPGVACRDVDAACRDLIASWGWADAFLHGTGHGVGLDIHEAPQVSSSSGDTLSSGDVVTVEPGVYVPEHGGVRIEDTVVVTDEGCIVLTRAPKEFCI